LARIRPVTKERFRNWARKLLNSPHVYGLLDETLNGRHPLANAAFTVAISAIALAGLVGRAIESQAGLLLQ
jgi:hypothetical protein